MQPMPPPPIAWPTGMRAAACFTFDVDGESAILSVHPAARDRLSVMSHQAYGPLVGVPRLLRILAEYAVQATFFVPGFIAERYTRTIEAIVGSGHEVAHHGYLHEPLTGLDEAGEREYLVRGQQALTRVAGSCPRGYRAPEWELNFRSPGLLAEYGFTYDSSLFDADAPYVLATGHPTAGNIVEIPVSWSADDGEQYYFIPGLAGSGVIESPVKVHEMWSLEFEAVRAEGGCFVLTNHPFLSGRPARAAMLGELLKKVRECSDVWIATCEQVASHVRTLGLTPRSIPRIELADPQTRGRADSAELEEPDAES